MRKNSLVSLENCEPRGSLRTSAQRSFQHRLDASPPEDIPVGSRPCSWRPGESSGMPSRRLIRLMSEETPRFIGCPAHFEDLGYIPCTRNAIAIIPKNCPMFEHFTALPGHAGHWPPTLPFQKHLLAITRTGRFIEIRRTWDTPRKFDLLCRNMFHLHMLANLSDLATVVS